MRHLYIIGFLLVFSTASVNAQDIQAENLPNGRSEQVLDQEKTSDKKQIHRYICRRCGSENETDWIFSQKGKKGLQLIPHCGFCGKKYWPKFKHSGHLERTYCLKNGSPTGGS